MLRLLILFLILQGSAATSEDTEGNSSGFLGDDEDGDGYRKDVVCRMFDPVKSEGPKENPGTDRSTGDDDATGGTLIIIIAAVSVTVLAIGSIVAIVLFRRYLQSREQGVYSVPAEQGQKAAV
ncbi:uncharacterized protein si:dkey-262k9.2 [Megalobrama amblycephala]|uniref:uncharacterized protein si:dkey-262k9.2 n=1 Tax=Megalobrama amblycephala TaxID=75352 RepID=UPI002013E584|nr:uncharacterized protein si:dkey-262k9.2 [Megalobrama amblycephala]